MLQDVLRIRQHPLVPRDIPIHGYIYDVKSGRLNKVAKATQAGVGLSAKPEKPRARLTAPAIGRHALIGQPQPLGRRAGLPEHVDRKSAARITIAADAQPLWRKRAL